MNIEINRAWPLNPNAAGQGAPHDTPLRNLQAGLQQTGAHPAAGADQTVWDETEQAMNRDGFAKPALVRDATLSGISAEFSLSGGKLYTGIAGSDGESDASLQLSGPTLTYANITMAEKNIYNAQMAVTAALRGEAYMYMWDDQVMTMRCVDDMTYREDPDKYYPHAEEVRAAFDGLIDEYVKKLREDQAGGALSEDEYNERQNRINEAYDRFAYKYGNYGLTDYYYMRANYGKDVFSAWEDSLNEIKTRYERGDFGSGEGVYEERVAAWGNAFDKWADAEAESLSHGPSRLASTALAPGFGEVPCRGEAELYWNDMRKLYENAKTHLLAGNTAEDLTDDVLNESLSLATAADRRFFYSDEYADMLRAVSDLANISSKDESEWENLYERFAGRIGSDTSIGNALKHILLEYFSIAAARLPAIFSGSLRPGSE
jgi:hypothetical protein